MEEPTEPTNPSVEEASAPGPAPEAPLPPPTTSEIPAASPYPPGYGPGTPPPPGPPPGYGWTWGPTGAPGPPPAPPSRSGGWFRRLVRSVLVAWIVAAALAATVIGLSVALATTSPSVAPAPSFRPSSTPFGRGVFPGPAAGVPGLFNSAVVGTVASVSSSSFTVNARSGQTVTVDEQSSTTYYSGSTKATSSIVTQGATVAVQGTRSGNTVTATRVIVLPAGGFGFPSSVG